MRLKQALEKKRPELIKRKDVVFHYDNARPHFDDPAKIEGAWLGNFDASTVRSGCCTVKLPFVSVSAELLME